MNNTSSMPNKRPPLAVLGPAVIVLLVGGLFLGAIVLLRLGQPTAGSTGSGFLASLFATDTVQSWWYVTRAAGLTAYFLLWLSMVWGLAVPSRFFHPVIDGAYSYDFHEFLSLLGLGFVLLHVIVLLFDKFLPFNILQVLIPFIDSYRPFWVGMGVIGFYIFLLVTVTFYIKSRIGIQAFRSIHVLSLLGYVGATLHGLFAGTDSAFPLAKALYIGTGLIVIFLTVYWMVLGMFNKRERQAAEKRVRAATRRPHQRPAYRSR
jgi:sulfoxide reductase heme-binding subunit YedZ